MRYAPWANLNLRTKALMVVALPAAATAMLAGAAYTAGSLARDAHSAMSRTVEAGTEIQALRTASVDASALARAYFLARDEALVGRIRACLAQFDETQRLLYGMIAGQPQQVRRLREITGIQRSITERSFATIGQLRAGKLPPQQLRDTVLANEKERTRVEAQTAEMLAAETRLLHDQAARLQRLQPLLSTAIGLAALGGVGGGCALALLFASGIAGRIRRLQGEVAKLATGASLDSGQEGNDEIGALHAGLLQAAESLERNSAAIENAGQGMAQADPNGRIVSSNRVYNELLGEGMPFLAVVRTEDRSAVEQALAQMQETGRGQAEAGISRDDGSTTHVAMTFLRSGAGPQQGYHVLLRDVTLQKQTEHDLIHAIDAALASSRAKTQFLAKISHDIRTPLNAILGSTDLLSQTALDVIQQEYVSMFQRNCRRLVNLINDFLDFSRIEAGAVRVERTAFAPAQLIEDVIQTFRETAGQKRIGLKAQISPHLPAALYGDPLRIQQVLTNLVSNALKFTQSGMVKVSASALRVDQKDHLEFRVADSGAGIAAADRDRIFAPFTQLPHARGAQTPGSGLGLTICRELVQLMDGHIHVESEEGRGSTFVFTVPLEHPPLGSVPSRPRDARRPAISRSLRILVAEDAEDNRTLLRHYLRGQPVTLVFAEDGLQAVAFAQGNGPFDLILMDVDMPKLDGHGATQQIRAWEADHQRPATPIVALSAHAIEEEVRACLEEGCVAHVAKPVDQATLLGIIDRYTTSKPLPQEEDLAKDEDLAKQVEALVPDYLASKQQQIEEALGFLMFRNFDAIRRFGHNLKGTGGAYGFPEIGAIGRSIEESALRTDEAEIARQLLVLSRVVSEAAAESIPAR